MLALRTFRTERVARKMLAECEYILAQLIILAPY